MDFAAMLDAIEHNMGAAPRRISWFRRKWRMEKPGWVKPNSDLARLFDDNELLLREGRATWATLVQANNILFHADGPNAPGAVVYSRDPAARANPEPLIGLAGLVFSLKGGTADDPQVQLLADILADEFIPPIEEPIPDRFSPDYPTLMTSLFFDRRHLPGRRIADALLPVLILPEVTPWVVLVPGDVWPASLAEQWR